jgi:hypothetical protein
LGLTSSSLLGSPLENPLVQGRADTDYLAAQPAFLSPQPRFEQANVLGTGVAFQDPAFASPPVKKIHSVLFVCAMNAVRSPMAEGIARYYFGKSVYVQSAGVRKGVLDGFAVAALDEIGLNMSKHSPEPSKSLKIGKV